MIDPLIRARAAVAVALALAMAAPVAPPAPQKPIVKKVCVCSNQCSCGCNAQEKCTCPPPVIGQPVAFQRREAEKTIIWGEGNSGKVLFQSVRSVRSSVGPSYCPS